MQGFEMNADAEGFVRENFDANVTVFQTGDSGDAAYVIENGCVEVLVGPPDGLRRVAVLAEGAMFGEVALLDHQPRTATVRTVTPTRLLRIDRTHVEELLGRADPVIQFLLRLLLERFRSSSARRAVAVGEQATADDALSVTPDLQAAAVRTLSLAHDLSNAIDSGQLDLYYQPIIHLPTRSVAGFEALVRWQHPSMGTISPDEFIPLAEKTGLIHRIGQWVMRRALRDWASLRALCPAAGGSAPFIGVNLSAPELCASGVFEWVAACLAESAVDPSELRIELTETAVIANLASVTETLDALRRMQIGIALDDFGTGYAGLDYLQSLPFSTLKIDKSFVSQMHEAERSFQIVKSALELSRLLKLSTVAEGIEDAHTANLLENMGCNLAQGYHFARPMPLQAAMVWAQHYVAQQPQR
jgi:EAL domain-containing protein (putative c-di-GMP-specific phosphodiesterase class I)/CRP-like cAMP-binding protein